MAKVHMFDVALAEKYGPVESIVLSNLCFWIEKNMANQKNYHKGRYWVYNSTSAFEKIFPYLSGDQIRRLLDKLHKQGVLYIDSFNKTGYDRTLWYSVNDEVMEIYCSGRSGHEMPASAVSLPICPDGQMHVAESPDAFAQSGSNAQTGKCISRIHQIDPAESPNGSGEFASPIPYNNLYKPSADFLAAEKETRIKSLKALFRKIDPQLVFSDDFYNTAQQQHGGNGPDEDYCRWLYEECLRSRPQKLRGLYYKLFAKPEMWELYAANRPDDCISGEEHLVQCPVCETGFADSLPNCPSCFMRASDMRDASAIERHRKFTALSAEEKAGYENALANLAKAFKTYSGDTIEKELHNIDLRYGLVPAGDTE